MAPPTSDPNMECILNLLDHLRQPASKEVAQDTIDTLFQEMSRFSPNKKDELVANGVLEVAIAAACREDQSCHFYHRALGVIIHIVLDHNYDTVAIPQFSQKVLDLGGVDCVIKLINDHIDDKFLICTCVYSLQIILSGSTVVTRNEAFPAALMAVLDALQRSIDAPLGEEGINNKGPDTYASACNIIGSCSFGPDRSTFLNDDNLYGRAVQCVFNGIVCYKDHEEAQEIGRLLLSRMVGPELAASMIGHTEGHHCEGASCGCAA